MTDRRTTVDGQLWVFDKGYWSKNRTLWENVQSAQWDNVILGEEIKGMLRGDVEDFFDREEDYKEFAVPWRVSINYLAWACPPHNFRFLRKFNTPNISCHPSF